MGLAKATAETADNLVDVMRWTMVATCALTLLLCFAIAYFIRRCVTRPITEISAMASNIANGALHLRMNRKETDDIGDLSRAIDLLLDRIAGSLALNEAVLSAVPDPIFMTDKEDVIILANTAATQLAGIEKEQMIGKRCTTVIKPARCGTELRPAHQWGRRWRLLNTQQKLTLCFYSQMPLPLPTLRASSSDILKWHAILPWLPVKSVRQRRTLSKSNA